MAIDILSLLDSEPNRVDFVLPGLVAGTVCSVISPGGTGKSALALQIAAHVAGGPDLLGIGEVKEGVAVYLPIEDPQFTVEHRIRALLERCSPAHRQKLAANLIVQPLENHNVDILDEQWFDALMRIATSRRLLILDTLRMAHSGDENDGGAMKKVTERLRMIGAQTGCTVIFLHHTNKTSMFNSTGNEQQASRGSSVLVDNVRLQYYLRTMTAAEAEEYGVDEERRQFFAEFGVSKQNYGVPVGPRWLQKVSAMDERIEAGYTLQSAVLDKNRRPKNKGKTEGKADTPPTRPSQEGVNNGNW